MTRNNMNSALMLDHATGSLPPTLALLMDSHVTINTDAAVNYQTLQSVGGALLDDLEEENIAPHALDHLMARIEREEEADRAAPQSTRRSADTAPSFDAETMAKLPAPLREAVGANLADLKWKRRGGGVRECRLSLAQDGFQASLLAIEPGKAIPSHTHHGTEYTLVLDGAYDEDEQRVKAGDLVVNDARDTHKPIADSEHGCLCFAVLSAPLKFRGPLGILLNRLQGF